MGKNFIEIYNEIEKSKKLDFLVQLLLKDSDLQQQFIAFTLDKQSSLDSITGVNIEELRDELWSELSGIDISEKIESDGYYNYYDDEGMGDELFEAVFTPFVNKAISFIDKGNYLDAFRSILAIYELRLIEAPDIDDDEYFVFGEDIESYIESFISSSMATINSKIEQKVISDLIVNSFINIFFERLLKYQDSDEDVYDYNISHFNNFFEYIINEPQNAKYLLKKIEELKIYDDVDSANIILHCADIIGDEKLYIKVANEFFRYNKQVAIKLQKRYKKLNMDSELARVSQVLFEQEDNVDYAFFVLENIDKELYEELYIIALKIYINAKHSIEHYMLLREYLDEDKRLEFIKDLEKSYNIVFYIQLLEIEKQYKAILTFVTKNSDNYHLAEIIKPIIHIYPDEALDIIKTISDKYIEQKGRSSYARACRLLELMLTVPQKKEALKSYVNELYNHQPRLPALRDELSKARLI